MPASAGVQWKPGPQPPSSLTVGIADQDDPDYPDLRDGQHGQQGKQQAEHTVRIVQPRIRLETGRKSGSYVISALESAKG